MEKSKLRSAFLKGDLFARSVSPEGVSSWKRVQAVHRTRVPFETGIRNVTVETALGGMVLTEDHKVYVSPEEYKPAGSLLPGEEVLAGDAGRIQITSVKESPPEPFMFDLTVEDNHNFCVYRTGVIVSNSPSRNYRFMPPQGEGVVGCYNQVFGYIWEDAEFAEYLEMALWKWNMQAPNTDSSYPTVESICQNKKSWQAALLWGSLVTAAQALVYNWIQQEFSVAGRTLVRVHLPSGREVSLPIEELYEICKGEELNFGGSLREAFLGGNLKTLSVDPETGKVGLHVIQDIMQHHTGDRASVTCQTEDGRSVTTTCDHSLFRTEGLGVSPVKAEDLRSGDLVSQVLGGVLGEVQVSVSLGEPLQVSYDLCVPGPENFVLSNGILAHNSYSIGGISLDIERSSKYESMKQNAEEQWDKLVEMKARTSKYLRGLQQPRFGRGVRSAFGPYVGRGVLSPRNFV